MAESHDIGALAVSLPGPDFGTGDRAKTYVTASSGGEGGHCATTTQPCLTDADCPTTPAPETCVVTGGSYRLHYTIRKR